MRRLDGVDILGFLVGPSGAVINGVLSKDSAELSARMSESHKNASVTERASGFFASESGAFAVPLDRGGA